MGKDQPESRTKSLLGNLNTRIFHANSDFDTNEWASKTIGESYFSQTTKNKSQQGGLTINQSFVKDAYIPPYEFTQFRTGGNGDNKRCVDAIVFVNGFDWGKTDDQGRELNYARTVFVQDKLKKY